jgi:hypothetical protein
VNGNKIESRRAIGITKLMTFSFFSLPKEVGSNQKPHDIRTKAIQSVKAQLRLHTIVLYSAEAQTALNMQCGHCNKKVNMFLPLTNKNNPHVC